MDDMEELKVSKVKSAEFGDVPVERRDCPLCGTNNDTSPPSPFSHDIWHVKNCTSCGFVYIDKAPVYSQLSVDMAWERTTTVEDVRREEIRPVSFKFSKLTRWRMRFAKRRKVPAMIAAHVKPGNVIDIGCGDGSLLVGLLDNYVPYGIEISKEIANNGIPRFRERGGEIVNAPALQGLKGFPQNFFSAAVMRSYLEHEMRPFEVLEETHRTLNEGGVALVKVPNFASINRMVMGKRWCGFRYPDHLNYFTPRTLKSMGEKCGFSVCFGLLGRLPTSDNLHAILRKSGSGMKQTPPPSTKETSAEP